MACRVVLVVAGLLVAGCGRVEQVAPPTPTSFPSSPTPTVAPPPMSTSTPTATPQPTLTPTEEVESVTFTIVYDNNKYLDSGRFWA